MEIKSGAVMIQKHVRGFLHRKKNKKQFKWEAIARRVENGERLGSIYDPFEVIEEVYFRSKISLNQILSNSSFGVLFKPLLDIFTCNIIKSEQNLQRKNLEFLYNECPDDKEFKLQCKKNNNPHLKKIVIEEKFVIEAQVKIAVDIQYYSILNFSKKTEEIHSDRPTLKLTNLSSKPFSSTGKIIRISTPEDLVNFKEKSENNSLDSSIASCSSQNTNKKVRSISESRLSELSNTYLHTQNSFVLSEVRGPEKRNIIKLPSLPRTVQIKPENCSLADLNLFPSISEFTLNETNPKISTQNNFLELDQRDFSSNKKKIMVHTVSKKTESRSLASLPHIKTLKKDTSKLSSHHASPNSEFSKAVYPPLEEFIKENEPGRRADKNKKILRSKESKSLSKDKSDLSKTVSYTDANKNKSNSMAKKSFTSINIKKPSEPPIPILKHQNTSKGKFGEKKKHLSLANNPNFESRGQNIDKLDKITSSESPKKNFVFVDSPAKQGDKSPNALTDLTKIKLKKVKRNKIKELLKKQ